MYIDYLKEVEKLIINSRIYRGKKRIEDWESGFHEVISCFLWIKEKGKKLFFIGNGGSAAIASHMMIDFMKNGEICTISLFDMALITCFGNDYGYESIYSRPLNFIGQKDDMLVAISSSGNSPNIVNAISMAKQKNMKVITFSGFREDNKIIQMGDYNIYVPAEHYGMVESIHNLFLQQIVDEIKERV